MARISKKKLDELLATGTAEVVSATRQPLGGIRQPMVVESDRPLPRSCTFARLSLPPSTNNLFISVGRRRVKSPEYRRWITENADEVKVLVSPSVFPVHVSIKVCGKINSRRDLDNIIKPTLDLLVSQEVIPDDNMKHVTGGRWDYQHSEDEPTVLVWWEPIQEV